jgi:GDSL-like Lipase/Acylhydrolase family
MDRAIGATIRLTRAIGFALGPCHPLWSIRLIVYLLGDGCMKIVWFTLVALALLTLLIELALRYFYGFGRPLIYQGDPEIGYLLAPNQSTRRFGNRIEINQYAMRSEAITPTRPAHTRRVFILGDSVANGGWWTDQTNTISEVLKAKLIAALPTTSPTTNTPTSFTQVEVLNASANSWGPRNELAYLQRFGLFETHYLILIINTDDLFSTTPSSLVVGVDRNYPDRAPGSAITEVVQRYVLPAPKPSAALQAVQAEGGDRIAKNFHAIQQIQELTQRSGAKLLLVMTPLLREVVAPGPKDYELVARSRLQEFTQQQHLDYIDCLPLFQAATTPPSLYHDHIHLSAAGNQLVSDRIGAWVEQGRIEN